MTSIEDIEHDLTVETLHDDCVWRIDGFDVSKQVKTIPDWKGKEHTIVVIAPFAKIDWDQRLHTCHQCLTPIRATAPIIYCDDEKPDIEGWWVYPCKDCNHFVWFEKGSDINAYQ